jgi:lysozyme
MSKRHINAAGLAIVKEFESLRLTAYRCPAGVPTIGWGHTKGVRMGQRITREKAEQFLREDMHESEAAVERLIRVPLTSNQFSALVSFTFNVGDGALAGSTLRRKLNDGNSEAVPAEMARWNKATVKGEKVTLGGLVRRRAAEAALWLSNDKAGMPQKVEK